MVLTTDFTNFKKVTRPINRGAKLVELLTKDKNWGIVGSGNYGLRR